MAQPHIVVEVALKDVPEIVATIERYTALRKACMELLAEVYVEDGEVLCPPNIIGHIRAITEALKAEEDA